MLVYIASVVLEIMHKPLVTYFTYFITLIENCMPLLPVLRIPGSRLMSFYSIYPKTATCPHVVVLTTQYFYMYNFSPFYLPNKL